MTSHFNLRSLGFYAVAIGSVVLLFGVVSSYGEAFLKAPRLIKGRYTLTAADLPGCLHGQPLDLLIQQSGVYLAGAIVRRDAPRQTLQTADEHPSLTGHWDNQTVILQGILASVPGCDASVMLQAQVTGQLPAAKDNAATQASQLILTGTLSTDAVSLPFQATPIAQSTEQLSGH